MTVEREIKVGEKTIKFIFNKYAKQANGSVMVQCGDTQVLVTACASDSPKPDQDFFPLTVDYIEKYYAAGRVPGGYFKREAKPSERELLTSRVIDRPLRPCFPENYLNDTVITAIVVSLDPQHHPAPLALMGASVALMVSDIPFNGPVASLRIGYKDGEFILDPPEVNPEGELDLNIAASPDAILMVEAGANFLSEKQMLDAIDFSHRMMKPIFDMQLDIQKAIGKPKKVVEARKIDEDLKHTLIAKAKNRVKEAFSTKEKAVRNSKLSELATELASDLNPDGDSSRASQIKYLFEDLKYNVMRSMILEDRKRIDGRKLDEIRPISCEVGILGRAHGSALFTRGETQSLGSCTLGAKEDDQRIDSILSPDHSKRFYLHYNFPPFSVGEARGLRAPGRREVGHGALAERALVPVIPGEKEFGYTIRMVSEILESNGSSSMASVCAGTLALLDAGVPIKQPVAGIAMGLVKEGDRYAILSDILGDEDHLGDMDFKVCGGDEGITALQMDIKIGGLSREIFQTALEQARVGRKHILSKLVATIQTPNEISPHAPRIFSLKIPVDRIRDLIGPGGKTIKKIIADTGVKIDIDDSGIVNIVSPDNVAAEAAKKLVSYYTSEPEVGAIFLGTVKKIMDFGAFVEIRPGLEGLCHISNLDTKRVEKVTDIVKEGEEILVKLLEIDRQGKMKLSRKDAIGKKPTA
jgi:polyribonucleotide nucleotidyltransferase